MGWLINTIYVLRSLMATNFIGGKSAKLAYPLSFVAKIMTFGNGLEYCNADCRANHRLKYAI